MGKRGYYLRGFIDRMLRRKIHPETGTSNRSTRKHKASPGAHLRGLLNSKAGRVTFSSVFGLVMVVATLLLALTVIFIAPQAAQANWQQNGSNQSCLECHTTVADTSSNTGLAMYIAIDGTETSTVSVDVSSSSQTFEVDYYSNNVQGSADTTLGYIVEVPDSTWTVAVGTASSAPSVGNFTSWDVDWDIISGLTAGAGSTTWSKLFSGASNSVGINQQYSFKVSKTETKFTTESNTLVFCSDGDGAGSGDKCNDADLSAPLMGSDFQVTVPSGYTTGSYTVKIYGIGHTDAGGANRSNAVWNITVDVTGTANNAPTISGGTLAQYKTDGSTQISQGGYTNETSIQLWADVSDSDSDDVTIEGEIVLNGGSFTDTANCTTSKVTATGGSGTAKVTCSGPLSDGSAYKWQIIASDGTDTSSWTAYGGSPDVTVDTTSPTYTWVEPASGTYYADTDSFFVNATITEATSGITNGAACNAQIDGGTGTFTGTATYATATGKCTGTLTINASSGLSDGAHNLTVEVADDAGNSTQSAARSINIDNTAPTYTWVEPASGTYYADTDSFFVNATITEGGVGITDGAACNAQIDGGTGTFTGTASYATATGKCTGTLTINASSGLSDGAHNLTVEVADDLGNSAQSAARSINIDNTAPSYSWSSPASGSWYADGDDITVTVGITEAGSGLSGTDCDERIDGAADTNYTGGPVSESGGNCSGTLQSSGLSDGAHTITVEIGDNVGNTATSSTRSVNIDNADPTATIDSATPGDGSCTVDWGTTTDGSGSGFDNANSFDLRRDTTNIASCAGGSSVYLGDLTSFVDTVSNGTTYYYRLCATDDVGNQGISSEQTCTPSTTPSVDTDVSVSATEYNSTHVDGTFTISAIFNAGGSSISACDYTIDNGVGWTTTGDTGLGLVTCEVTNASCTEGDNPMNIAVRATNANGNTTTSTLTRTCDATAPSYSWSSPASGSWYADGDDITVTVGITEAGSGLSGTDCDERIDGAADTNYTGGPVSESGGNCSGTLQSSGLSDGAHTITVEIGDNVGNTATSSTRSVNIDNADPTATIDSATPGDGSCTVDWGTTTDGSGSGFDNANSFDLRRDTTNIASCAGGSSVYTGDLTSFADTVSNGTTYYYRLCATDDVGNQGISSEQTCAPSAGNSAPTISGGTLAQYKTDGSTQISQGGYTNETSIQLWATVNDSDSDDVTIEGEIVLNGGAFTNTPNCTASKVTASGGSGTAKVTCSGPLSDGSAYKWQIIASDGTDTSSWTAYGGSPDVTVDTTAPTYSFNAPAADTYYADSDDISVDVTITESNSGITDGAACNAKIDGATSTFTGTATYVLASGKCTGTLTINASSGLSDGAHNLTVEVADDAGNSAQSGARSINIDNSAPSYTFNTPAGGTYYADSDDISIDVSITEGGTGITNGTACNAKIDGATSTFTGTATYVLASGQCEGTLTINASSGLSDGAHNLTVEVADDLGNSAQSGARSINIDNSGPTYTWQMPASGAYFKDSGDISVDVDVTDAGTGITDGAACNAKIDGATSTFTGTATYASGTGKCTGTLTINASSGLSDGAHNLTVVVTDDLGNSAQSAARSINIDNTAPSYSFNEPGSGEYFKDGGSFFVNATITEAGIGIANGTACNAQIDGATSTFTGTAEYKTASGQCEGTLTINASSGLSDGAHNLTVEVADDLGNTQQSGARSINIDNTAPTYTWNTPASGAYFADGDNISLDVSITEAGAGITNGTACNAKIDDATSTFTGTAEYKTASGKCEGTLTINASSGLSDGAHNLTVEVADDLGNTQQSGARSINIDNTAPTYTWNTPASGAYFADGDNISLDVSITEAGAGITNGTACNAKIDDATSTFTGTAEYKTASGKCEGTLTINASSGLSDGAHNLTVEVADDSGNTQQSGARSINIDNTAPTYTWNTPAADTEYADGDNISLDVSITEGGAGITNGAACNAKIDGATSTFTGTATYATGTGKCTGTLTINASSGLSDGAHNLTVEVADDVGNSAQSSARSINIDNTAIGVSSTSPADVETDVTLDSNVTINFDDDLDCDTVNTTNITIDGGDWTLDSCSGSSATFTTGSQAYSTDYTVTVSTSVTDNVGNALSSQYQFTYTTEASIIPDPPTGVSVSGMRYNGPLISWNTVSNASTYNIYRSTDNSTWSSIGSVSHPTSSYRDSAAPYTNTKYWWTVTAENGAGESTKPAGVAGRTALNEGWNIVSGAVNTSGKSTTQAFGSWAYWSWDWISSSNIDPDNSGNWNQNSTIEPGKSTWVWAFNGTTVLSASGSANAAAVTVTLRPGWNLISNQLTTNMEYIDTAWTIDQGEAGEKTLRQAILDSVIGGTLYWWNGSTHDSYTIVDDSGAGPAAEPWKGYWILNLDSVNHTLTIQHPI